MTPGVLVALATASSVALFGAALSGRPPRSVVTIDTRRSPSDDVLGAPSISPRALAAIASGVGACAGALVAGVPGLLGGGVAGAAVPVALQRRRRTRRVVLVEGQLLDAVTAIAASVRSGRSLAQSIEVAGQEVGAPLGPLLRGAGDRVSLGVSMDAVLLDLAETIGGADARLVTGVLRLHRRTGGAMAASLDDLARTLRARRDGARELRSLTAQARLSAAILGLLPLGFFLFLSVVARRDVESAYHTSAGASAIGIGLALQGAAFVWIRRLLRVETG